MGDRVVVRVVGDGSGEVARREGAGVGLRWERVGAGGVQIFQGRDPWMAARAAAVLAGRPGVEVAMPVMRRRMAMHRRVYAGRPNDPLYPHQWHLENRDTAGRKAGPDLHVRSAWVVSEGAGVVVAISDDGFETQHPDLRQAAVGGMHYDFVAGRSNLTVYGSHATCVAGLVAATDGNGVGVSGVAPKARMASWMIFDSLGDIASDEALMDMFQHRSGEVGIQNHSWGNASQQLSRPTAMEVAAISNAVTAGRGGLGVVMVRSGGNDRDRGSDVNDDGYANDPGVIAVGAVRKDGRVAGYSNPGACLLVSALSGDEDDISLPTEGVATTDRVGSRGYNRLSDGRTEADYAFRSTGFSGTSASAPQISGVVALMLAANPRLTLRDVQQVLIHASAPTDPADPDRRRNGAGYWVDHNAGYGVPDAGRAVRLAEAWIRRPLVEEVTMGWTGQLRVPDAGLRFWVGSGFGTNRPVVCETAPGPHPDDGTAELPLVAVGQALSPLNVDLTGKGALIQRGGNTFREKLTHVARAGAAFGVFYNNTGGTVLDSPGYTDFVGIPAVFISQNDGEAMVVRLGSGEALRGQVRLQRVERQFEVGRTLVCEHVGVRVNALHPRRGDLRIALVSPSGTRSVLQRRNFDPENAPTDWTYWSTQHFYEPSAGVWRVEFSDQLAGEEGLVRSVELRIRGVAIEDTDRDGLDDGWERRWFGGLAEGPAGDPDGDGSTNAREQVLGTDPTRGDGEFRLAMMPLDAGRFRLAWPAVDGEGYRLRRLGLVDGVGGVEAEVPGVYPEAEWVVPSSGRPGVLYSVERVGAGGEGDGGVGR